MASLLGVSQKCHYALRALYELSKRYESGKVASVVEISEVQSIPYRFLEQIFSKLRSGGYVESKRGNQGGFVLAVSPSALSVGEIIRFIEGPAETIQCIKDPKKCVCGGDPACAFKHMWLRAKNSMIDIFDTTSFHDLVNYKSFEACLLEYEI